MTLPNQDVLAIVRTTCLLESRSARYGDYLTRVLPGRYHERVEAWSLEESRHGVILRDWLAHADPTFDFDEAFERYSALPYHDDPALDRAPADELLSRCVVEALASGFYRALRDATDDASLKRVCTQLMGDEARHLKGFMRMLGEQQPLPRHQQLRVVAQRVLQLDDDQIIYASHCADGQGPYVPRVARRRYLSRVYRMYDASHLQFVSTLIGAAVGLRPTPGLRDPLGRVLLGVLRAKAALLQLELPTPPTRRARPAAEPASPSLVPHAG